MSYFLLADLEWIHLLFSRLLGKGEQNEITTDTQKMWLEILPHGMNDESPLTTFFGSCTGDAG